MGLPLRIALPIFVVIAALFIAVMGYFVKVGLGNNGTALGAGAPPEQGDALYLRHSQQMGQGFLSHCAAGTHHDNRH